MDGGLSIQKLEAWAAGSPGPRSSVFHAKVANIYT